LISFVRVVFEKI